MTARLQWETTSGPPVILDYDPNGVHGADRGIGFSRRIVNMAMELAFVMMQLGMTGNR